MNEIYLSKSSYCKCVQCEKIHWLNRYKVDKAVAKDDISLKRVKRRASKGLFGDYGNDSLYLHLFVTKCYKVKKNSINRIIILNLIKVIIIQFEEYIERMSLNFFGEYWDDDVKSETICFRVSKNAKNYFTNHADGKYGSTQKAMESIFKKYMESVVYKRGKVNNVQVILLPKFDSREELNKITYQDIIEFDDDGWYWNHLGDFTIRLEDNLERDVIVESYYVSKGISDVDKEYFDDYFDFEKMEITIDDYIVIPFYFNNYLDLFKNGVYKSKSGNGHEGLVISEYNDIDFYIYFKFDKRGYPFITLITNEEAYRIAMDVDNVSLANIIASYNEDINTIEDNANSLKNRKKDLENQIKSINNQLKKIDK